MDWTATINAYCERTDASFWSEPLNAVSNAAFLVAAAWVLFRIRPHDRHGAAETALAGLVFVIGIGSFLFHTFATRWAALADVLPITLFIFAYFAYALFRFVGFGWPGTLLGTGAFFLASLFAEPVFSSLVGSSASYLPGLFAMLGIGFYLKTTSHPAAPLVLCAGIVFTLSLAGRIADEPLCDLWPYGTHFLWHVFNAITLALLLAATFRRTPTGSASQA